MKAVAMKTAWTFLVILAFGVTMSCEREEGRERPETPEQRDRLGEEIPPMDRDREGREGLDKPGMAGRDEIHIFLREASGKSADLKDVTAEIVLQMKDGSQKTLKTEIVTPTLGGEEGREGERQESPGRMGQKPEDLQEGKYQGQVVQMGEYKVEFVALIEKEALEKKKEIAEPYLLARLWLADEEFTARVNFTIKGESLTAEGFRYPYKHPGIGRGD
ncbi:MAG: hypothetical protein HY716_03775 [Planctomycetes bacterium]|nr:hypothetical protein [Planctomycetota bacterium]